MATFTKSVAAPLLTLQSVAASSVAISSAFDLSTKMGGMVQVRFGRRAATAAGAGANIRIEVSRATSGDNTWFPLAVFTSAFAAVEGEAISVSSASGQKVVSVASTTNLVAGDIIFIDNTTIGNSEWGRIKSISANASVTLEDDLVNTQGTSSTLYDAAEIYSPVSIPEAVMRIRAVADGALFTQAFAVEVSLMTIDGIS